MRVKVSDVDGIHASTPQAGARLYAIIESALARGEVVPLDFEGVKHFAPGFFNCSIGVLIEQDTENRLTGLLRYENLPPLGQSSLESVVEYATRRREDPRWAAAMEAVVRKRSEAADE
jgi:hypothetical protein